METLGGGYFIKSRRLLCIVPSRTTSSQSFINWYIDLFYDLSLQALIMTLKLSHHNCLQGAHGNNIHRLIISHLTPLRETDRVPRRLFTVRSDGRLWDQRWCWVPLFILPFENKKKSICYTHQGPERQNAKCRVNQAASPTERSQAVIDVAEKRIAGTRGDEEHF